MMVLKSIYSTLRDWFDPSLEGSPYDPEYRIRQNEKKTQKQTENKAWHNRRWARI